MCELLGFSANYPTDIRFSLGHFILRGGETGPHKDGWGMTFYEGLGYHTFKERTPCFSSPLARFIQANPIESKVMIAHIRQANCGKVNLENTHPFTRELWGKNWTFAHNGQLRNHENLEYGRFQPIGKTDSEKAFCWILNQLSLKYPKKPSSWVPVFRFLAKLANQLRENGVFNMLFSDGKYVMAFCTNNLYYITYEKSSHHIALIATQPILEKESAILNQEWHKIQTGQFVLFRNGERVL